MPSQTTNYHAEDLLKALKKKNLVEENTDLNDYIIQKYQDRGLPIYLKILLAIGAFISAIFFIILLIRLEIIDFENNTGLIIWGSVFAIGAIALQWFSSQGHIIRESFFLQCSLALMLIGKALFIIGLADSITFNWKITLAAFIATVLTYPFYRVSIDRFLSCYVVLIALLTEILLNKYIGISRELLFNLFVFVHILGVAILLIYITGRRDLLPLSYALVFSLSTCILVLASNTEFGYSRDKDIINPLFINPLFTNLLLSGGLIATIGWAAGGFDKLKSKPLILAAIGSVLLNFISAPGIILALILMILGYARHNMLLIILGALLTPVFIMLYYYNLDITLPQKSGILLASGALLLTIRFYITHQGWHKTGDVS